ncbi:hypothetical protein FA95DRAFT_1566728 [Auriscalpium vulgare]|uniref:Uncharacterized protein n=1 Tax=Auriscalpium vulgare TaxID=40419 RepID=A0ACB8R8F7_9AGAM|nr:hypothetical protein FA95DRAFT_1566728 [Auriscalpium vulgare]
MGLLPMPSHIARLLPVERIKFISIAISITFIAVGLFLEPSDTARLLLPITPLLVISSISTLQVFPKISASDIVTLQYTSAEGKRKVVGAKIRIEPLRHSFTTMKRKLSTVLFMEYPITLEISVEGKDLWFKGDSTRRNTIDSAKSVLKRVFQELLLPQCHRWQTVSFQLPKELLGSLDEIFGDVPADWTGLVGLTGVDFEGVYEGLHLRRARRRTATQTTVGLRPDFFAQSCNLSSITFNNCVPDVPWTLPAFGATRRVYFSNGISHVEKFLAVLESLTAASPTAVELYNLELDKAQNAKVVLVDIQNVTSLVIEDPPSVHHGHMIGSEVLLRLRLPDLTRLDVSAATYTSLPDAEMKEMKDRSALALKNFLLSNPPPLLSLRAVKFMHSELEGEMKAAFEHFLIQRAWKRQHASWDLVWGRIGNESDASPSLRFEDFPWPTVEKIYAPQGELIEAADVERFIRLGATDAGSLPTLSDLRNLDLSWGKCEESLNMLCVSDEKAVQEGIKIVRACLKDAISRTVILRIRDLRSKDSDNLSWDGEFAWLKDVGFKSADWEGITDDDVETFFAWLSSPVDWAHEVRSKLNSTSRPQDVEPARKVLRNVVDGNQPGAEGANVVMRCLSALFKFEEELPVE